MATSKPDRRASDEGIEAAAIVATLRQERDGYRLDREALNDAVTRLRAENEALKHFQQWRAVGIDKAEGGIDVEIQPWRADLGRVKEDRDYLEREDDPPFDEILIETRWLSKPERYVETDETRRYACGVDAETEVTCDHCPDPDGCIDGSYKERSRES